MGSGTSRCKGACGATALAYPLPALSPMAKKDPAQRSSSGLPLLGTAPVQARDKSKRSRPVRVHAETGNGSQASARPTNTQYRPGSYATKHLREPTPMQQRPHTELSQATTRPNTELHVLGGGFGAEQVSPPLSDRSLVAPKESVVHFPPAPDGDAIVEEDGKSSTTFASASQQDPASLPPSRGMTPSNVFTPPSSRPGTRGVDKSLGIPHEHGEERMEFPDDEEEAGPDAERSFAGSPQPGEDHESRDSDLHQHGRGACAETDPGSAGGEQDGAQRSPTSDLDGQTENETDPGEEALASGLPSRIARRAMSTRRPNTELSKASTAGASSEPSKINLFEEEEELDEIEQLRRKKAAKLKREAENLEFLRARVKELAGRVMQPAEPDALIFEMHWGFPPRTRSSGSELRPPTPPPAGWEEVVRANRRFRLAIRVTLSSWLMRSLRNGFNTLQWTIADKKYYREKEHEVRGRLDRWFRDILFPLFGEWKGISAQMANMRKKSKKVMMWIMNKDIIRALGAWVAVWAHKKDWRVCALKNCLHTRIKKSNRTEILLFAKAKRGGALLHEFATLTLWQLIEQIAASKIDIESVHQHLTIEELLKQGVFKINEKDKALNLVWKIDRLMREDTNRLDQMSIWDGKMLMSVDIYMDDAEELQAAKDKLNSPQQGAKTVRPLKMDLSPVGLSKQVQQMNIAGERMMDTWAWGYILDVDPGKDAPPAKLQAVKANLIVQDYGIAMAHVVDVYNQTEFWQSEMKNGLGPDPQWYEFEFGEHDEEGNYQQVFLEWKDGYAVIVSISDRGNKDESANPCRYLYYLDHRSMRQINPQVSVRPGSFNGKWSFTPGSRSIEMQVVLRVDEDFGKDPDDIVEEVPIPTEHEREVELIQAAQRKVEETLRKIRKGSKVDSKQLDEDRIALRRVALNSSDDFFEDRLGYMTTKKLSLEAPTHTTCAFHSRLQEYWMLDANAELNFLVCDLDGRIKRDVRLTSSDNLKIFSFCFDNDGDLFIANNQHTFFRYIPADNTKCDTYLRMWKVELFETDHRKPPWQNASGITCNDSAIFAMFKQGPILELSKAAGSVMRVIHLNFRVTNVEQICFIMHRLVFVDAHSVRVCSIPDPKSAEQVSELVWVPLGPQGNSNNGVGKEDNPNAHAMGCNSDGSGGKVISWRSYIEDSMDRPRILWDGSFLWISEAHLRKTDDNQLKTPSYLWHCYAPMTLAAHLPTSPDAKRRYGKRDYIDLGLRWDSHGRLHATIRDTANDHTPSTGTTLGSTSMALTPSSHLNSSFSRQPSGLDAHDSAGKDDGTHFKRPLSPVHDDEDSLDDTGADDDEHILKPFHSA